MCEQTPKLSPTQKLRKLQASEAYRRHSCFTVSTCLQTSEAYRRHSLLHCKHVPDSPAHVSKNVSPCDFLCSVIVNNSQNCCQVRTCYWGNLSLCHPATVTHTGLLSLPGWVLCFLHQQHTYMCPCVQHMHVSNDCGGRCHMRFWRNTS